MVQSLLNRREDEAALRAAVALARPGQALGPAGRVYGAFRALADRGDPFRPERLAAVASDLQASLDPQKAAEFEPMLDLRPNPTDSLARRQRRNFWRPEPCRSPSISARPKPACRTLSPKSKVARTSLSRVVSSRSRA
ncbi:DUF1403 family protein [Roseiarcus sp.]|uniref:DUF1403 family protein n=1 Tax=Roseiarcus sp. TaxID=1969460 RepID=UPI003F95FC23